MEDKHALLAAEVEKMGVGKKCFIAKLNCRRRANANIEGAANSFPVVRRAIIHVVHLS